MKRARRGARVVYIPGNHDEMFRQFTGLSFGGVEIRRKAIHETADGRKLLVLHGDEFDAIMLAHRWLAFDGAAAYALLLRVNVGVNPARRRMGLDRKSVVWGRGVSVRVDLVGPSLHKKKNQQDH